MANMTLPRVYIRTCAQSPAILHIYKMPNKSLFVGSAGGTIVWDGHALTLIDYMVSLLPQDTHLIVSSNMFMPDMASDTAVDLHSNIRMALDCLKCVVDVEPTQVKRGAPSQPPESPSSQQ